MCVCVCLFVDVRFILILNTLNIYIFFINVDILIL